MADNDDHETYVVKGTFMRGHAIHGQQLLFSLDFASARSIAMLYDHTCNDSAMRSYVSGAFKPSPSYAKIPFLHASPPDLTHGFWLRRPYKQHCLQRRQIELRHGCGQVLGNDKNLKAPLTSAPLWLPLVIPEAIAVRSPTPSFHFVMSLSLQ